MDSPFHSQGADSTQRLILTRCSHKNEAEGVTTLASFLFILEGSLCGQLASLLYVLLCSLQIPEGAIEASGQQPLEQVGKAVCFPALVKSEAGLCIAPQSHDMETKPLS